MGRTLEQILKTEKPAVVADATAKAKIIMGELQTSGDSTSESCAASPAGTAKSDPRDMG
jgi:hypothetical protein